MYFFYCDGVLDGVLRFVFSRECVRTPFVLLLNVVLQLCFPFVLCLYGMYVL